MSTNEKTDDSDTAVLWEKLQTSQRKRMKLIDNEKEKLQNEKDIMNSKVAANTSADDIVEIDAGGTVIRVLRSTLTHVVPDTVLAYMFSGRWEESLKRDSNNGRIFLNHDPELIVLIVNFLRTKAIEDPSSDEVIVCPKIPDGKKQAFRVLLNYFGLTDFFYPSNSPIFLPLDINNISFVHNNGTFIKTTKSKNKIQFSKNDDDSFGHDFVACKPPLESSGEGSFWKITIDTASEVGWLLLGIVGNINALNKCSHGDSTSYGWASSSSTYHKGISRTGDSDWKGFTPGECLYFHLGANKLTMFSVQKNKKFTMNVAITDNQYSIHSNVLTKGTNFTLEQISEEERAKLL